MYRLRKLLENSVLFFLIARFSQLCFYIKHTRVRDNDKIVSSVPPKFPNGPTRASTDQPPVYHA